MDIFHGVNPEIDTVPAEIRDMSQHNVCADTVSVFKDNRHVLCDVESNRFKSA